MQQRQTISQSDVRGQVDFIWQPVMTRSVDGPRRNFKVLPNVKFAPKIGSWPLFGGLLPVWSTTAFWILVKPFLLRCMLSQSMRCTKNCNACNHQWSTERAQFFSETTPNHTLHNHCFKSWTNWAMKFCLICHIHLTSCQLTTTFSSISTTFCGENASQLARCRKCIPKVHWLLKDGFLCYKNKQTFLIGKNVLVVMVPIFINKDVLEPSYNDLKFRVQTTITLAPT